MASNLGQIFGLLGMMNDELFNVVTLLNEEKYEEAIPILNSQGNNQAVVSFKNFLIDGLMKQSKTLISEKNYNGATSKINEIRKVTNLSPDMESILLYVEGNIFFKQEQYESAFDRGGISRTLYWKSV